MKISILVLFFVLLFYLPVFSQKINLDSVSSIDLNEIENIDNYVNNSLIKDSIIIKNDSLYSEIYSKKDSLLLLANNVKDSMYYYKNIIENYKSNISEIDSLKSLLINENHFYLRKKINKKSIKLKMI